MYGCENGYIFAFGFKYVPHTISIWCKTENEPFEFLDEL